jgi:hypothetical protein
MSRQQAMAQIQAALAAQSAPTVLPKQAAGGAGGPGAALNSPVSLPHAAPSLDEILAANKQEQERYQGAAKHFAGQSKDYTAAQSKLAKDQDKAAKAQIGLAREQKREQDEQRTRTAAAFNKASQAIKSAGGIVQGTKIKLEGLPTPGSIMFPLLTLLFLFLILIPVNGNSRLQWLWYTIIGDAQIGSTAPPPGQTPTGGILQPPPSQNGQMTGAQLEEVRMTPGLQPFTTMETSYL